MSPQPPDFAPHTLKTILARTAVLSSEIISIDEVKGGFSGAGIWRIKTMTADVALRRWPQPGLSPLRLHALHNYLHWLTTQHFHLIPAPLRNSAGESLFHLSGELWQVEPWSPGTADFKHHPSDPRLRAVMQSLARLHLLSAQYTPTPQGILWFSSHSAGQPPALKERLAILQAWNNDRAHRVQRTLPSHPHENFSTWAAHVMHLALLVKPRLEQELEQARSLTVPLFPCLRDLWHDHLLFEADQLTGLIDPAACRTESVAGDLTRLLGSLFADDTAQWNRALDFYNSIRPLTPSETNLLPVYNHSQVLIACLNWIEWISLDGRPIPADENFQPRLNALLHRLEHLAQTC